MAEKLVVKTWDDLARLFKKANVSFSIRLDPDRKAFRCEVTNMLAPEQRPINVLFVTFPFMEDQNAGASKFILDEICEMVNKDGSQLGELLAELDSL